MGKPKRTATVKKRPDDGIVRLNLGCGPIHISGYRNMDRALGDEAFPLNVPDGSVDEIRASHLLEHFSHTETLAVLTDWVSKLKPGGCLKIAVPDFKTVASEYLAGKPINVQGYAMGGHVDNNDIHLALFDEETLMEVMATAGLQRIGKWVSEIGDDASLPISLNLVGYKPCGDELPQGVFAVLATARYGPIAHHTCAHDAFGKLGIPYDTCSSCFWAQTLSNQIEKRLSNPGVRYILACDFDTIFSLQDVLELYRLMQTYPRFDAIAPRQVKRGGCGKSMFAVCDEGMGPKNVYAAEFDRNVTQVTTAHFGLTLIKADALRNLPRPWMMPIPNADGKWDGNHIDPDIDFWRRWREAGFTLGLANRVTVGHMEDVVSWPGKDGKTVHQYFNDYLENGIPAGADR